METEVTPSGEQARVRTPIPWARLVLEIFVIVFGILSAFGIDAWWDHRQDRAEEQQVLAGLLEEFQQHAESLEGSVRIRQRVVRYAAQLMNFLASRETTMSLAALDSAVFWGGAYAGTWDPANSALNAVVNAGRLELITNAELRNELAGWQSIVDEVRDNQLLMRDFSSQVMWPALARRGVLARAWNRYDRYPPWPGDTVGLLRYERLRGDQELIDLLATKYQWSQADEADGARATARRIISHIERELR